MSWRPPGWLRPPCWKPPLYSRERISTATVARYQFWSMMIPGPNTRCPACNLSRRYTSVFWYPFSKYTSHVWKVGRYTQWSSVLISTGNGLLQNIFGGTRSLWQMRPWCLTTIYKVAYCFRAWILTVTEIVICTLFPRLYSYPNWNYKTGISFSLAHSYSKTVFAYTIFPTVDSYPNWSQL